MIAPSDLSHARLPAHQPGPTLAGSASLFPGDVSPGRLARKAAEILRFRVCGASDRVSPLSPGKWTPESATPPPPARHRSSPMASANMGTIRARVPRFAGMTKGGNGDDEEAGTAISVRRRAACAHRRRHALRIVLALCLVLAPAALVAQLARQPEIE
jgi:hypothetical protein